MSAPYAVEEYTKHSCTQSEKEVGVKRVQPSTGRNGTNWCHKWDYPPFTSSWLIQEKQTTAKWQA